MTGPWLLGVLLGSAAVGVPVVEAKTFVMPHVLEKDGGIAATPFTFDTTIFMTYASGLADTASGGGAFVDFFLLDSSSGKPMTGKNGGAVCNPCSVALSTDKPEASLVLEDLIQTNGGGFDTATKNGIGVFVVGGADPEGVSIQGFVVNAHTSPFDLSVFGFEPQPLAAGDTRRTFVLPHILERAGTIATTAFTFDTTIFAVYGGGLGGLPFGGGANFDVYLYDGTTSQPLHGANGVEVCNPCTFGLGEGAAGTATPRKRSIRIDDLITANGGGFPSESVDAFALVVLGGADPGQVSLQGFVVNSHTSAFDLAAAAYPLQPVLSEGGTPGTTRRTLVIPHVFETKGGIFKTTNTFDTVLEMTYTGGLAGLPDGGSASVEITLYDEGGGVLRSTTGEAVCNPCVVTLGSGGSLRKKSVRIDDLITAKGGFADVSANGSAVIVVGGADPAGVNVQAFVVNSHSGPTDLSFAEAGPRFGHSQGGTTGPTRRTYVIPHVLEKSGSIRSTPFTFDTTLFATYQADPSVPIAGGGATVDLYLYDRSTGQLLRGSGGTVCGPCTVQLNDRVGKQTMSIDDLIVSRGGGFDVEVKEAFGLVVVEGDAERVSLQGFIVNSHTSAFDVSVFGFEPQPILAARMALNAPLLSLSGQVVDGGAPVAGVPVPLSGTRTRSLATDSGGFFRFYVPSNGTYTVTPRLQGRLIRPPNRTFSPLTASSGADFTLVPALAIGQAGFGPTGFGFTISSYPGVSYTLEYTPALETPDWRSLTSVLGDGGTKELSDSSPPPGSRIYRVRME